MTTRLCKYHGRSCEYPGACLNRAPRKYEGDGTLEDIDPERIILGVVVRMPYQSGAVPTFSDSVVTGIFNKSYRDPTKRPTFYDNLKEALDACKEGEMTQVKVSRPYLYAHNIGGAMPNWLVGVDTHECQGNRFAEQHKVVVMSTGEYANHNAWREPT